MFKPRPPKKGRRITWRDTRPVFKIGSERFEFKTGHPVVNDTIEHLLPKWYTKYGKQIKEEDKPSASIITHQDKGATIMETVGSVVDRLMPSLREHARITTEGDRKAAKIFRKTFKKDFHSGTRRVYTSAVDLLSDDELVTRVGYPDGSRGLEESSGKYSEKSVTWTLLALKRNKNNLLSIAHKSREMARDTHTSESGAVKFMHLDKNSNVESFHNVLEKLLSIDRVGSSDEEKNKLRAAYSEALKGLTLYRFRNTLSSRHYLQLLDIIRRRVGDKELRNIINSMEKSRNPYDREVASAVKTALNYIPRQRTNRFRV